MVTAIPLMLAVQQEKVVAEETIATANQSIKYANPTWPYSAGVLTVDAALLVSALIVDET